MAKLIEKTDLQRAIRVKSTKGFLVQVFYEIAAAFISGNLGLLILIYIQFII